MPDPRQDGPSGGTRTEDRGRRAEGGGRESEGRETGEGSSVGPVPEVAVIESRQRRSATRRHDPAQRPARRGLTRAEDRGRRAEGRGRRSEIGSQRAEGRAKSALSGRSTEVAIIESRQRRSATRNWLPESSKGPAGNASDRPECKAPNGGAGLVSAPPSATRQAGRYHARSGRPVARRTGAIRNALTNAEDRNGPKSEVRDRKSEGRGPGEVRFVGPVHRSEDHRIKATAKRGAQQVARVLEGPGRERVRPPRMQGAERGRRTRVRAPFGNAAGGAGSRAIRPACCATHRRDPARRPARRGLTRTEDRGRRAEVGRRRSEVRGRKSEVAGAGDGRRLLCSGRSTEVAIRESGQGEARRAGASPHAVPPGTHD